MSEREKRRNGRKGKTNEKRNMKNTLEYKIILYLLLNNV